MAEWPTSKIGELGVVFDGPHATPKTVSEGPIFLGIGALQDGRINLGETRHVTPDDFTKWTRRVRPQAGDVVFSYETRLGQAAIIPEGMVCCLGRRMGLVRLDQSKILPRFFLYNYLSPGFQEFLRSRTVHGATVDRILLTEFPDFPFPCPPIEEQRRLATLLGSIDDKIELNRRMNETLEAMARAIFKDWFVDFGPTRAKAEGRPPYLAPELWDLFPDGLDEEDKPAGWETSRLSELAYHHRTTVSPGAEPAQIYEHYSIPAFDSGNEPVLDVGASIKSNKTVVPEDAVLLSKLNPEIERVWLPNSKSGTPQVTSTEFLAFTPVAPATRAVLYCLFKCRPFREEMTSMVTGTSNSHQRVSPKLLLERQVLVSDPSVLAAFDKTISPLLDRLLANRSESKSLAQTRDLLLPKLMSGEIRLRPADEQVEEVV